ncbi:MAG TPA: phosphoribosylglycinamide formyltransferase [Eubacteriaceae bacterium]|jgi:phosphoribosylglycinamide formyltransferase-1|nr:phosphoribosylglycinamide formyltransferase [Eubacteriaceae bacterium]
MSPVKIGILISGQGSNLQAIIDHIESGHINGKIELVISNKKDAYGLVRSKKAGIESLYVNPRNFKSNEEFNLRLIEEFQSKKVDLIILAGFLKILSKDFIEKYPNRIINIHPSLIPSFSGKNFYGNKVHEAVLNYGVKYTGVTVHFVDEGTDTGPIILQEIVPVYQDDTVDSLQKRVIEVEHRVLVRAIKLFCEGRIHVEGRKVIIN